MYDDAAVTEASGKPASSRYAAADVFYPAEGGARSAAVVAAHPTFHPVVAEHVAGLTDVAEYQPGRFADRELPALRAVLAKAGQIDLLIVDGYVDLDPHGRRGLGAYAHAEFGVPVIGVAKTAFHTATHAIEGAIVSTCGSRSFMRLTVETDRRGVRPAGRRQTGHPLGPERRSGARSPHANDPARLR